MSDIPFEFPVIAFWRDPPNDWITRGSEDVFAFNNEKEYRDWSNWSDEPKDLVVVDDSLRTWRVSAHYVDRPQTKKGVAAWWDRLMNGWKTEILDFTEEAATTLDAVKARACASIDANPHDWIDDEAVAGESGPPISEEECFERVKAKVRRITKPTDLIKALDLEASEFMSS